MNVHFGVVHYLNLTLIKIIVTIYGALIETALIKAKSIKGLISLSILNYYSFLILKCEETSKCKLVNFMQIVLYEKMLLYFSM